jgi:transcriptional regulator GlxA family with amidase domain
VHVQILLVDAFDPMDALAPLEAFVAAGEFAGGVVTTELVSAEGPREVESGVPGVSLWATGMLDPERPGVIVVPGVAGPVTDGEERADGAGADGADTERPGIPLLLAAVAQTEVTALMARALAHPEVTVLAVCGGSLALALGGLLEGRHAVTHMLGNGVLEATGVEVVRARIVDDGDLITTGGVTSSLDGALYAIERLIGPQVAAATERYFETERRGTVWRAAGPSVVLPRPA